MSQDYLNTFKYLNIKIANNQQIMINKLVKYIKDNNYYGELYHEYRNEQMEATNNWTENYYLKNKKDFGEKLKDFKTLLSKRLNFNKSEIEIFKSKLS